MKQHSAAMVICPASIQHQWMEFCEERNIHSFEKFLRYKPVMDGDVILIIDEAQRLKNALSKTARLVMSMKTRFSQIVMLSACPFPNSILECFSASFLTIECFGNNYWRFLGEHSVLKRGVNEELPNTAFTRSQYLKKGFKQTVRDGMEPKLLTQIARFSESVPEEVVYKDMPERTWINRVFEMGHKQKVLYEGVLKDAIAILGDEEIPIQSKLACVMKLQQIESNFFYREDKSVFTEGTEKITALKELLDEIYPEKVIIYTQFVHEWESIMEQIDDVTGNILQFQNGEKRCLVGHPKACGIGANLQIARFIVFYSLSYSWEDYFQACGRIYRIGQERPCVYYHLLAAGAVSHTILNVLKQKRSKDNLIKDILNDKQRNLRHAFDSEFSKTERRVLSEIRS